MPRGARGPAAARARKRNQSVHGRGPREPRAGRRQHAANSCSSSGRAARRAAALVRLLVQARCSCHSFRMKLNRMKYEGENIQILLIFLRPLLVHSSPRLPQPICKWNWAGLS